MLKARAVRGAAAVAPSRHRRTGTSIHEFMTQWCRVRTSDVLADLDEIAIMKPARAREREDD